MIVAFASMGHDVSAKVAPDLASAPFIIEYRPTEQAFVVLSARDGPMCGGSVITTQNLEKFLSESSPSDNASLDASDAASESENRSTHELSPVTVAEAIDMVDACRRDNICAAAFDNVRTRKYERSSN